MRHLSYCYSTVITKHYAIGNCRATIYWTTWSLIRDTKSLLIHRHLFLAHLILIYRSLVPKISIFYRWGQAELEEKFSRPKNHFSFLVNMPENHNLSKSDPTMMEMNRKFDIILVKLRKIQKEFSEYKKTPEHSFTRDSRSICLKDGFFQ